MILALFLVGLATFLFYRLVLTRRDPAGLRLPPGPTFRLPVIGQGHLLGVNPTVGLRKLRKQYGDIVSLEALGLHGIYVSSLELAEEMMGMEEFSGRGDLDALAKGEELVKLVRGSYPTPGLVSSDGQLWKEQRRFALRHLRDFGFGKASMQDLIVEEFQDIVELLKKKKGKETEVNFLFNSASLSVIWRIVTGRGVDRENARQQYFFRKIQDLLVSFGVNNLLFVLGIKFIPRALRRFDPFLNKMSRIFGELFEVFREEREEHERTYQEGEMRDFIDVYIKESRRADKEGDKDSSFYGEQGASNFLNVMFDLFMTGSETTSTSLTYVVLYCLHHPREAQKVREEVDRVVGRERRPHADDRENMPYLEAFLHEVQRHGSLAPLAVPHSVTRDCQYRGYDFKKHMGVSFNLYEIMHDEANFPDPERFDPGRFLDPETGRLRVPRAYIPFGYGKHECLGKSLAKMEMFLFACSLIQNFTFEPASTGLPGLDDVTIGIVRAPKTFSARFIPRED